MVKITDYSHQTHEKTRKLDIEGLKGSKFIVEGCLALVDFGSAGYRAICHASIS
jgi:hypothetical protein